MNKRAILCIDDESIVLDSLSEQLQNELDEIYMIEVAESGEEALEVLEELDEQNIPICLVISDYIMPGMTGDKVLEKIKKRKPSVRTILLTGQANLEGVEYAVNNANLYRFILKPWNKDDLLLTVKEALLSYEQDLTIRNQNKELKQLNVSLEEKVEQRTRELRELNAAKDKFFSIIAHDLKNPFNTILGFTDLLHSEFSDYSEQRKEQFIKIIHTTAKTAYELLENLLDWARSQTGRLKCMPVDIDLDDIFDRNLQLLNEYAAKKSIEIKKEGTLGQAFADDNMITTVMRNLISNAIKFTPDNGCITVASKKMKDEIQISVNDNGIGIKKEDIPKLFKIDAQYSTEGTNQESGTGLGLLLCKEFINQNKGKIWVDSKFGKGSTFTFTLPFHENR
jgi:signal transduction histidine kinase